MTERKEGQSVEAGLALPPNTFADWRRQRDEEKLMIFLSRFRDAEALGKFLDEHDRMRDTVKGFDSMAKELEYLVEERERRDWLFRAIKSVATWMIAVTAAIAAFKGFFSDWHNGGKP